jgi:tetratricopeptide (TPR) repeat protein
MRYYKNLKKIISIIVIIAFAFHIDIFLHTQVEEDMEERFIEAKNLYIKLQYGKSKEMLEWIIGVISDLESPSKKILGKCYLLLGAIYEKKGETIPAEENYRNAKKLGIESIEGVDLDGLSIYERVVKVEIYIETQFQKAVDEYNNGQYDNSKNSLEQIIGTIKKKGLEVNRKDILGKCYLLLGAIYEKKENIRLAEENYSRAIVEHEIEGLDWINFDDLPLLKKVVNTINNEKQFEIAKTDYLGKRYIDARSRTVRTISIINEDPLGQENILGKCYLLLGAIYEKEGNTGSAEENYRKARRYGIKSIEGIDFERLSINKKIMREGIIPKLGEKKKKKFPVLIVAGVVVVAVVVALILSKKKKEEYTLTVTRGEGINGTPTSGTTIYEKGSTVDYNYIVQSGYKDLVVTLDGTAVATSGTITMNRNHTLNASATPLEQYTLTVTKGTGVGGTPDTGTYTYDEGTTANYNYYTQNGYTNLVVQLDGVTATSSGTIQMNSNHTLTASASPIGPKVTITFPSNGKTVSGKIDINVDVQSSINIDRVEFYVDNNRIDTDRDAPYSSRWNTRNVNDGNHTIRVVAVDSGNNTGEDQISVYVNNGGGGCSISVAITDPSNDETVNGTVTIRASTSVLLQQIIVLKKSGNTEI